MVHRAYHFYQYLRYLYSRSESVLFVLYAFIIATIAMQCWLTLFELYLKWITIEDAIFLYNVHNVLRVF